MSVINDLETRYPKYTASTYLVIVCVISSTFHMIFKLFQSTYSFQRLLITRFNLAMIINTLIITKQQLKVYYYDSPRIQKGLYLRLMICVVDFAAEYTGINYIALTEAITIVNLCPIIIGVLG